MPVIINYKRCDMSPECSCIPVCQAKAFYWHRNRPAVDLKSCISCNKCVEACPAEAVLAYKTEKQLEKARKKIAKDRMTHQELFKERYGAETVNPKLKLSADDFSKEIQDFKGVALVEFYAPNTIQCRIKSIKFEDILPSKKAIIRKMNVAQNNQIARKYKVRVTPSLAVFKKGSLVKLVESNVDLPQKKELKKLIKAALKG